jgi:hypothetical protein
LHRNQLSRQLCLPCQRLLAAVVAVAVVEPVAAVVAVAGLVLVLAT